MWRNLAGYVPKPQSDKQIAEWLHDDKPYEAIVSRPPYDDEPGTGGQECPEYGNPSEVAHASEPLKQRLVR
jgi:hypothetical protein